MKIEDQITAVCVGDERFSWTCQREEAGGYVCGRCGLGALSAKPEIGQTCGCGAIVIGVRRGPPLPTVTEGWL